MEIGPVKHLFNIHVIHAIVSGRFQSITNCLDHKWQGKNFNEAWHWVLDQNLAMSVSTCFISCINNWIILIHTCMIILLYIILVYIYHNFRFLFYCKLFKIYMFNLPTFLSSLLSVFVLGLPVQKENFHEKRN